MQAFKYIQTGMVVAGLAAGFAQCMGSATEQRADQDERAYFETDQPAWSGAAEEMNGFSVARWGELFFSA